MVAELVTLFPLLKPEKGRKKRSYVLKTSPLFDQAWKAYPASGRARQSRFESYPIWVEIAQEVGEETLLACVVRYAKEDKASKEFAPGFERWLKWGRWDNWMPGDPESADVRLSACFPDTTIRQACLARLGEPWCVSYLDRCAWVDGVIVTKSGTVFGVMSREPVFREIGAIVELKSI